MAVLDAYALTAALLGEPAAEEVLPIFESREASMSAANLAESYDRVLRNSDLTINELDRLIETLEFSIVPVTEQLGRRMGQLRSTYYSRIHDVSLADCAAAATAELLGEPIATPDRDLAALARDIGVAVIALPDSAGNRPN